MFLHGLLINHLCVTANLTADETVGWVISRFTRFVSLFVIMLLIIIQIRTKCITAVKYDGQLLVILYVRHFIHDSQVESFLSVYIVGWAYDHDYVCVNRQSERRTHATGIDVSCMTFSSCSSTVRHRLTYIDI